MHGRRIEAFLLRLVIHDDETQSAPCWRGRVQHVTTGEERQFDSLHDLLSYVQLIVRARIDDPALPPPPAVERLSSQNG